MAAARQDTATVSSKKNVSQEDYYDRQGVAAYRQVLYVQASRSTATSCSWLQLQHELQLVADVRYFKPLRAHSSSMHPAKLFAHPMAVRQAVCQTL